MKLVLQAEYCQSYLKYWEELLSFIFFQVTPSAAAPFFQFYQKSKNPQPRQLKQLKSSLQTFEPHHLVLVPSVKGDPTLNKQIKVPLPLKISRQKTTPV